MYKMTALALKICTKCHLLVKITNKISKSYKPYKNLCGIVV